MNGNETPNGEPTIPAMQLRHLSPADWAAFGVQQIAYIRPVLVNGVRAMAIHAAGTWTYMIRTVSPC